MAVVICSIGREVDVYVAIGRGREMATAVGFDDIDRTRIEIVILELTRNLAQRFNTRFGETFRVPEATILKASAKIYDLQNPAAKMSKTGESPNGSIQLLEDPKLAAKGRRVVAVRHPMPSQPRPATGP